MKQAQQMQAGLAAKQEELAIQTVDASVGGGKVTVIATCAGDVLSIKIDQLAELAQSLRRENADLRLNAATLITENADLSRRMQEAYQRVSALLEKIPLSNRDEEAA